MKLPVYITGYNKKIGAKNGAQKGQNSLKTAKIVDIHSEIERVLSLVTARKPRAFKDYENMMSLHDGKSRYRQVTG